MPTKKSLAGVVGLGVAAALIAFTAPREGVSLTPYSDRLAHGLATVCYGETNVEMRTYSSSECKQMLSDSLGGYAAAVKDMTPGFDTLSDGQKVAAIDFTYNHGVHAYSVSTVRHLYSKKDFPEACEWFVPWAKIDDGKKDCKDPANKCIGLYTRALAQRKACLS